MTPSLNSRLLLASSVVLAGFLGATGLVLDRAFRDSAETALRDRLQGHVYALLAASDLDERRTLRLPPDLPDPRFSQLGSGLYGEVVDAGSAPVWRSQSMLGTGIAFTATPATGKREFARLTADNGASLYGIAFTVSWEEPAAGADRRYTYRVAEGLAGFDAQIARFRRSLWGWLGAAALLLLVVQGSILRWGLAPLRRVAADVRAVEAGLARRLAGDYPQELRHLTDNLNALLESADSHLRRYRDSLGNLAHSLKTPLAIVRGAVDSDAEPQALRTVAREQLDNMARLVEYQLQRAATSGRTPLATPVAVRPIVEGTVAALTKVHAAKHIDVTVDIDDAAVFHGDAGDLTEMLGNLLDNAFKWCGQRVRVAAHTTPPSAATGPALDITVEDDGPGIPGDLRSRVLERGARADQATPGHGLGLAMVQDAVALYRGELTLEASPLGGLAVKLRFVDDRP